MAKGTLAVRKTPQTNRSPLREGKPTTTDNVRQVTLLEPDKSIIFFSLNHWLAHVLPPNIEEEGVTEKEDAAILYLHPETVATKQ